MKIPYTSLSETALTHVIDEFVTRDGTDLVPSHIKAKEIRRQLVSGNLVITFDEPSNSCHIVSAVDL